MRKLLRFVKRLLGFTFRAIFSGFFGFLFSIIIYVLVLMLLVFMSVVFDAAHFHLPFNEIIACYDAYGFKIIFIIIFLWMMSGKDPLEW